MASILVALMGRTVTLTEAVLPNSRSRTVAQGILGVAVASIHPLARARGTEADVPRPGGGIGPKMLRHFAIVPGANR